MIYILGRLLLFLVLSVLFHSVGDKLSSAIYWNKAIGAKWSTTVNSFCLIILISHNRSGIQLQKVGSGSRLCKQHIFYEWHWRVHFHLCYLFREHRVNQKEMRRKSPEAGSQKRREEGREVERNWKRNREVGERRVNFSFCLIINNNNEGNKWFRVSRLTTAICFSISSWEQLIWVSIPKN